MTNLLAVFYADTMEDGQHLIYTSWDLQESSSLEVFALAVFLEFTSLAIII